MMQLKIFILAGPLLLMSCKNAENSAAQTKKPTTTSTTNTQNQNSNNGTPASGGGEVSEVVTPPEAITGILLSCGKPGIADKALNIDCLLKDKAGVRVDPASLGSDVVYGQEATDKDDDVFVTVHEAKPNLPYDVRYTAKAKDVTKIKKVIDSTTFFAKVLDAEGKEIKNRIKPFRGIDLEFPTKAELLEKWKDVTDLFPF